jgi:hypothetical protein
MADIPDISETELWTVNTTLKERYGHDVPLELGDAEIRLIPADRALTPSPVVHWQQDGCNFVVFKTGDRRYRCQFFFESISNTVPAARSMTIWPIAWWTCCRPRRITSPLNGGICPASDAERRHWAPTSFTQEPQKRADEKQPRT